MSTYDPKNNQEAKTEQINLLNDAFEIYSIGMPERTKEEGREEKIGKEEDRPIIEYLRIPPDFDLSLVQKDGTIQYWEHPKHLTFITHKFRYRLVEKTNIPEKIEFYLAMRRQKFIGSSLSPSSNSNNSSIEQKPILSKKERRKMFRNNKQISHVVMCEGCGYERKKEIPECIHCNSLDE